MEAQIMIPSGWAKLRSDKPVRAGHDRSLNFEGPKPVWKLIDPSFEGALAVIFPMVIFKPKPRVQGGKDNG